MLNGIDGLTWDGLRCCNIWVSTSLKQANINITLTCLQQHKLQGSDTCEISYFRVNDFYKSVKLHVKTVPHLFL